MYGDGSGREDGSSFSVFLLPEYPVITSGTSFSVPSPSLCAGWEEEDGPKENLAQVLYALYALQAATAFIKIRPRLKHEYPPITTSVPNIEIVNASMKVVHFTHTLLSPYLVVS